MLPLLERCELLGLSNNACADEGACALALFVRREHGAQVLPALQHLLLMHNQASPSLAMIVIVGLC